MQPQEPVEASHRPAQTTTLTMLRHKLRVALTEDARQLDAERHALGPAVGLEGEFEVAAGAHRRQLEEVARQDELQPAKRPLVVAHAPRDGL